MKKKAVSLLLVAAMAAGMLAGCGNGKSSVSQNGSDGSKDSVYKILHFVLFPAKSDRLNNAEKCSKIVFSS